VEKGTRREDGPAVGISAPAIPVADVAGRLGAVLVAALAAVYGWWRIKRWRWERRYRAVAERLAGIAAADAQGKHEAETERAAQEGVA